MELEEEIISDKVSLASLHFKAKQFTKCIDIYTDLISSLLSFSEARAIKSRRYYGLSDKPLYGELVHPKLCNILDQRAASYQKTSAIGSARQDARHIVALDPVNCKGYLRIGKIFLLLNDEVGAYKAYQQGVYLIRKASENKSFIVPERLWSQLQTQYRELNSKLKHERGSMSKINSMSSSQFIENQLEPQPSLPAKTTEINARGLQGRLNSMLPLKRITTDGSQSTKRQRSCKDIFEIFPNEIIERVFVNLTFGDVLRALLVCKKWYETLVALPRLYRGNFNLKHRISAPEYFQGLKLMKKVSSFSFSGSVHMLSVWSTLNVQHFGKIIESVVTDQSMKLSRLHLIDKSLSIELLLRRLEKNNWKSAALESVQHLRLGINSSLYNGEVLLQIFPSLRSLEIVGVDQVMHRSNISLLPTFSEGYHQLILASRAIKHQPLLNKLSLINFPMLKRDHQPVRPGEKTFDPRPPFLDVIFANLTELKITGHDFTGLAVKFQAFLREVPCLKEVYLENNEELSLKKFLLLTASCSPSFRLNKLTLRESHKEGSYNIDELFAEDLGCISSLSHLDIYGSSITSAGLLKLLALTNKDNDMIFLNIGHSSYIQFKNDNMISGNTVLRFAQVFKLVPRLESLLVPELSLDNLSMKLLREDLSEAYLSRGSPLALQHLDLSFCPSIDGIGLMNLFLSNASRGSDNAKCDTITLKSLTLHGMHYNQGTLQLLQKKVLVKNLLNDPFKKKWKIYGVNSFVPETDSFRQS